MKKMNFMNFAAAALVGLSIGIPTNAPADDTEIYTGDGVVDGVRPNVLMILDTSGSMSATDGTSPSTSRLQRMKDALYEILDNADNINIGLMRFTDPGGPILFPVAKIDADASDIDAAGQPDVSVRISDDNDDAEELINVSTVGPALANDVKVDSLYLELLDAPAFGPEFTATSQVASGPDDGEQIRGSFFQTSTTLETVSLDNGGNIRTVGFRFGNVENADRSTEDATVLFSQLLLTAKNAQAGKLDLKIFGLYAGDTDSFPPGAGCGGGGDFLCRLGLDGKLAGDILPYATVETYGRSVFAGSNMTDAVVTWTDVPDTVTNEQIESPDLSPIIQEIFNHPDWQSASDKDDLALFYTGTTDNYRNIHSRESSSVNMAQFTVDYVADGASAGRQLVALRFRNVRVPQGAVVTNANIALTALGASDDAVDFKIIGEKVVNAPQFDAIDAGVGVSNPAAVTLSSRRAGNPTTATEVWKLTAADTWAHEQVVQTPDIKSVVGEIVGQGSWCGGNDMVFFIEYDTVPGAPSDRRVYAHDADPSFAATLKVDYDQDGFAPGTGCTTEDIVRQVSLDKDDAEQFSDNSVSYTSSTMEMTQSGSNTRTNGVIFRDVRVHRGSTIKSAVVEFTAKNGPWSANAATLVATGEPDGDVLSFQSALNDVSNRISGGAGTTATVAFTMPPAAVGTNDPVVTADLSPIITEITGAASWDFGDDLAIIFTGTGRVDLRTHDDDPSKAARLKLTIEYNIGDVIAASGTPTVVTVRERLKEVVAELNHSGYTPIVDTMYEAALYYRGETVRYGASRGSGGSTVERNTRVSHPGSYEKPPGSVKYPLGCNEDDSNLSSEACRDQTIIGSPNYVSPIDASCQENFIVMLTDGEANHNNSVGVVQSMTGLASCKATFSNGDSVNAGERCGIDLSEFLVNNDQAPTISGKNTVTTYTIGFNIALLPRKQFIQELATAENGFYTADSASELANTFKAIFTDVLSRATSFAAPSLSVNAFNRLEDRNEVYFSLFEPSPKVRWDGNIKKFQLCQSSTDDCAVISGAEVGEVLDSRDPPLKAVGADGRILDTALSFWAVSPADGPEVLLGGTGNQVPDHTARRVLTFSDNATQTEPQPPGTVTYYPSSRNLADSENLLIDATASVDGTLDGLVDGTAAQKLTQTQELLGMGAATPAEIRDQINWIRGKDVDDQYADADFGENRYSFSDPLHGNPLALTYGGTSADPIIKLLAGTNDGGIRLINSYSGVEEWIFYPPSLLGLQQTLRANPSTDKEYGVDGSATPWIRDAGDATGNKIGVIEPAKGDFIRVFIGQRRGGNNYWGLDISPTTEIPEGDLSVTTHVNPKLMWRIRGGTPEFPMLGQTWSRPFLTTMLFGTDTANQAVRRTVLIFAGGYEEDSQDGGFATANAVGNAIYVVDAETGERLFFIGGPGATAAHGGAAPVVGVEVADMLYPIPSDVAAFDSDGDGSTDRVYVGDTGGQMWRVDFSANRDAGVSNIGLKAVVGQLATVSSDTAEADKRKFFYPPSIIQVRGPGSQSNADYDLVSAVTGNRANPLNRNVKDRFYAFRDYALAKFIDANADGLADGYTTIRGDLDGAPGDFPPVPVSTFNEMTDLTVVDDLDDLPDPSTFTAGNGYYIRLQTSIGEKGLAAPVTIAGKLFFTTYLPEGVVSSSECALAEGRGQLYGIDAITGAAIFNWDNDVDGNLTHGDRTYALGAGIPSNPVPVFFPEKVMLLIGVGGGAEAVDPGISVPKGRTYWLKEED